MMRNVVVHILLGAVLIVGCTREINADLWDCQFAVQKENAGKDAAAAAERARGIEACMNERGYRLDTANRACLNGSVNSGCYAEK